MKDLPLALVSMNSLCRMAPLTNIDTIKGQDLARSEPIMEVTRGSKETTKT